MAAISVDSRHCHANWAWDLGGVSFPILSDFHPRGAIAEKYGVYLDQSGITDRATVIIDTDGIVQHIDSVGPSGRRDIEKLLEQAKSIAAKKPQPAAAKATRKALSEDATLYVREGCRFCASVLRAMKNLRIEDRIVVRDVNQDPAARAELDKLSGEGAKVPALVQNGKVQHESQDIIRSLAELFERR